MIIYIICTFLKLHLASSFLDAFNISSTASLNKNYTIRYIYVTAPAMTIPNVLRLQKMHVISSFHIYFQVMTKQAGI